MPELLECLEEPILIPLLPFLFLCGNGGAWSMCAAPALVFQQSVLPVLTTVASLLALPLMAHGDGEEVCASGGFCFGDFWEEELGCPLTMSARGLA